MESNKSKSGVALELTNDEALVLFEWLAREHATFPESLFEDPAEQRVLWDVLACLERLLLEPFSPLYLELLQKARAAVRGPEEEE